MERVGVGSLCEKRTCVRFMVLRSRMSDELQEIYDVIDIVQQLRWLVNVDRMDKSNRALKVFEVVADGGSRERGRSPLYWKDQVEPSCSWYSHWAPK